MIIIIIINIIIIIIIIAQDSPMFSIIDFRDFASIRRSGKPRIELKRVNRSRNTQSFLFVLSIKSR